MIMEMKLTYSLLAILGLLFLSGCASNELLSKPICSNDLCEPPEENNLTCAQDCGGNIAPSIDKGEVIVLVDSDLFPQLVRELETWKADVTKDSRYNLSIKSLPPTVRYEKFALPDGKFAFRPKYDLDKANTVRDYLKTNSRNAKGLIFIGNIMPPKFYDNKLAGGTSILSDYFFEDFDNKCFKEFEMIEGFSAFPLFKTDNLDQCTSAKVLFWKARITPNYMNDLDELKRYFSRNHEYRAGSTKYSNEIVFYSPITCDNLEKPEECIPSSREKEYYTAAVDSISSDTISTGNYDKLTEIPLTNNVQANDKKYLSTLSQKKPQVTIYNGHGSSDWQQSGITPELIQEASPSALYTNLLSCSVGDFSVNGYLAGRYVFAGDGLAANANTVPIFGLVQAAANPQQLAILNNGGTFADWLETKKFILNSITNSLHGVFVGDPTLRIKQNVPKTTLNISLNDNTINFNCRRGSLENQCPLECGLKGTSLMIKNSGNKDALIYISSSGLNLGSASTFSLSPDEARTISLEASLCNAPAVGGEELEVGVVVAANTDQTVYTYPIKIRNS